MILHCNKIGVAEVKTECPCSLRPERTLRLSVYERLLNFTHYPFSKTQGNLAPGYSGNSPFHTRIKDLEGMDS